MRLTIRDQKEFAAGLIFTAIGLAWGAASFLYPIGRATEMGPGYFPLIVSVLLTFLGICAVIRASWAEQPERLEAWNIAPLLFVLGGVAFFAICIERFGLVVATVGLIAISSYKRTLSRPFEVAAVAVVTAGFVSILFINILQLDLKLF